MPTLEPVVVDTPRLQQHVWAGGPEDGVPLLLVHGNLVSGGWWRYVAEQLPDDVRVVAPDLRGFGRTEAKPIDATRGLDDMVDDLRSLLETLGWADAARVNAGGWSMGGGVLWRYALKHRDDVASLTQVAPVSPFGFGGTQGTDGRPNYPDFAGSGAGGAAPEFVRRLELGDVSEDDPASSVRLVMRNFFGARGNIDNVDEDFLLAEVIHTKVGEDFYPGDGATVDGWPTLGPGTRGVLNTMSPAYYNASGFVALERKPPVTWVRGEHDQVISDGSMFDLGFLGSIGVLPGWPGSQAAPPQPMAAQTRAVLDAYRAGGGVAEEVVLDAAHGMPVEVPDQVARAIADRLVR